MLMEALHWAVGPAKDILLYPSLLPMCAPKRRCGAPGMRKGNNVCVCEPGRPVRGSGPTALGPVKIKDGLMKAWY